MQLCHGSTPPNCTRLGENSTTGWRCASPEQCASISNSDVSGLGVLTAFFVTALVTFVLAWALFVFSESSNNVVLGVLDRSFFRLLNKIFRRRRPLVMSLPWQDTCQQLILAFADAHLITGIAVLLAGFTQTCNMITFDFALVLRLGWISSSVHLVALTICRTTFRHDPPSLYWRLVGMTAMYFLLLTALILTASMAAPISGEGKGYFGHSPLQVPLDAPAVCLWTSGDFTPWRGDAILAIVIVSTGSISRACKITATSDAFFTKWLRDEPGKWWKNCYEGYRRRRDAARGSKSKSLITLLMWWHAVVYLNVRALYDIFGSLLSELIWLTLSLLWGYTQIAWLRSIAPGNMIPSAWDFGQWLPMLLLLGPLFTIPEVYLRHAKEHSCKKEQNSSPKISASDDHAHVEDRTESPTREVQETESNTVNTKHHHSLSSSTTTPSFSSTKPEFRYYRVMTSHSEFEEMGAPLQRLSHHRTTDQIPLRETGSEHEDDRYYDDDDNDDDNPNSSRSSPHISLFSSTKEAYKSFSYRCLVIIYMLEIIIVFGFLMLFQLTNIGKWTAGSLVNRMMTDTFIGDYAQLVMMPMTIGPFVLWTFLVAPFSKKIRRELR